MNENTEYIVLTRAHDGAILFIEGTYPTLAQVKYNARIPYTPHPVSVEKRDLSTNKVLATCKLDSSDGVWYGDEHMANVLNGDLTCF